MKHGWAVPSLLDATPPPVEVGRRPRGGGGGGHLGGGSGRGDGGGVQGGAMGGGGREGRLGGGVQVGQFGVVGGGGHRLPLPPLALPHG